MCLSKWSWGVLVKKKRDSLEVTEAETFASYSEKLKQKYGDNWLGKGKGTGLGGYFKKDYVQGPKSPPANR